MVLFYLLIGFIASVIAAVPPGAANIVIVKNSNQKRFSTVLQLIIGAGVGELLLALFALYFTMRINTFFQQNSWIQIVVFSLFLLIGLYFLVKNNLPNLKVKTALKKIQIHAFLKGFTLAFINPPVLIFWVIAITIIQKNILHVSDMSSLSVLLLFFLGVLLGKTGTLYVYSLFGKKAARKENKNMQRLIGIALVLVGVVQSVRFFIT